MIIVDVVLPVFILVLIGYLAAYSNVIRRDDIAALSRFIFNIALPVLLFDSLANMSLPERFDWHFLFAYYLVVVAIYGLGMLVSRRWFKAAAREQSIFGMGASYSNLMLVGLPIISAGLGDAALLPLFLLVSVHSAILFFMTAVLLESGARDGRSARDIAWQTGKSVLRNPIIIALALGIVFNLLSVRLPQPVASAIGILSEATLPCSLFVLGAALTTYKIAGHFAEAGVIIVLKLLLQPVLVWILVFWVFDMDPLWGSVAVMAAGMPIGISAYIFAQNYQLGTAALSTAVLLSTVLAVFSQSLWLLLLT